MSSLMITKKTTQAEAGMASILITMVTMVVVSLIVIGFATITRREQSQTLDQQLSTQAFYAAESGIEDARHVIASAVSNGLAVPSKTDCSANTTGGYSPNYPTGAGTVIDSTHNTSYSCLLVDPNPTTLIYKGVGNNSIVVPMNATQIIDQVRIAWSPPTAPSGTPANCPASTTNSFTPATGWTCGYGMLRLDLVPTEGSLTRASLMSNTLSTFFMPLRTAASGNLSYSGNLGRGNIVAASCNTAAYTQCTATIVGLGSVRNLALRITSMYQTSDVTITGMHGGTALPINGAQAIVDVTGNANGVLRRIQARIPVNPYTGIIPNYAIETNGSLCKRFLVGPNYLSIPADIQNPDTSNQMCVAQTSGSLPTGP